MLPVLHTTTIGQYCETLDQAAAAILNYTESPINTSALIDAYNPYSNTEAIEKLLTC